MIIIEDVTFSLPLSTIAVNFTDGTSITMPITNECADALENVVEQVRMSFSAAGANKSPTTSPKLSTPGPLSSASSTNGWSAASETDKVSRRTPSSLLLSLLSPLISNNPQSAPAATPKTMPHVTNTSNARVHRRQARSSLVDAYRRYVLPVLKEELPSAYLLWSVKSESERLLKEFEKVKEDVTGILTKSNVDIIELRRRIIPLTRCQSSSSSSLDEETSSLSADTETCSSPLTPATSISSTPVCQTPSFNARLFPTPQAFMTSLPVAHALPHHLRSSYTALYARLEHLVTRLSQMKKLGLRYEREEGKRRWLDGLECGRLADRAVRRGWSSKQLPREVKEILNATPLKGSKLWKSITAEELKRKESESNIHPAMMEDTPYASYGEQDVDSSSESSEEQLPVTPTSKPIFASYPLIRPAMPRLCDQKTNASSLPVDAMPGDSELDQLSEIQHIKAPLPSVARNRLSYNSSPSWENNPVVGKVTSAMESLLLAGPLIKAKLAISGEDVGEEVQIEGFYGQCGLHV